MLDKSRWSDFVNGTKRAAIGNKSHQDIEEVLRKYIIGVTHFIVST
jgi:hypothetical protein